jgi:hypothetical protein
MKRLAISVVLAACVARHQGPPVKPMVEQLDGNTLSFTPTELDLERFATQCGVADPSFQDSDLYDFSILGRTIVFGQYRTMITIDFHRTIALASDHPVNLDAFGVIGYKVDTQGNKSDPEYGQGGLIPDTGYGDSSFEWFQGTDATELDSQALSNVTVRFDALPNFDGDAGVLTLRMVFADGGVYHVRLQAPLVTASSGCPAG